MRDRHIPNSVVRTSTIPEDLGRISYLLSDKTGTLTQNGIYPHERCVLISYRSQEMIFKKLHMGSVSFSKDTLSDVKAVLESAYEKIPFSHLDTEFLPGKLSSVMFYLK